jgi:hypothetical protein
MGRRTGGQTKNLFQAPLNVMLIKVSEELHTGLLVFNEICIL